MNYKLLFPTYRNRYSYIKDCLNTYSPPQRFKFGLNLGSGEGDYDPMIASYCEQLISCDINENDVEFAKQLNKSITNITYQIENALELTFGDDQFDFIVSVDVIEHVGEPWKMLSEVYRVLKPGGYVFMTFPQINFPWTYDPINRFLSLFSSYKVPLGAYAFGHTYLIDPQEFQSHAKDLGFKVKIEEGLTSHLAAIPEIYWIGIIQRFLKSNSANVSLKTNRKVRLRPGIKEPGLVFLTDAFCKADEILFSKSFYSVNRGFVLQK